MKKFPYFFPFIFLLNRISILNLKTNFYCLILYIFQFVIQYSLLKYHFALSNFQTTSIAKLNYFQIPISLIKFSQI